jgi:acyl-homoserine lactone acylase PvdQ
MGYAEAQDRLWALKIKKFLIEGRMSELFGREGLPTDYFSRNFKFHDVGVMNANLLD